MVAAAILVTALLPTSATAAPGEDSATASAVEAPAADGAGADAAPDPSTPTDEAPSDNGAATTDPAPPTEDSPGSDTASPEGGAAQSAPDGSADDSAPADTASSDPSDSATPDPSAGEPVDPASLEPAVIAARLAPALAPEFQALAVPIDPTLSPSAVGLVKSTDLAEPSVTPGDSFQYQLAARCSGLTAGCVDAQLVDVIPAGLDIVSLPQSIPGQRTVVFDPATRTLTVTFIETLVNPAGRLGLTAGATRNLFVGVRLPVNSPITDGSTITNTGELSAANAPAVIDAVDVPVTVPQVVRPVATKTWSDGSAVAGSAEAGTIGINISNQSSSSAQVTSLVVTDATPATWNNFDFTGATVTGFPAGANVATLQVCTIVGGGCTDGQYQSGAATNGATPLSLPLPTGVTNDQVTGVRVVFANGANTVLPVDLTGGTLTIGTVLRGTNRVTGQPIAPATRQTVANCASPAAAVGGSITTGADSCKGYDILPNLVVLGSAKRFFPDTNGNFEANANEYAVLGENSPASAVVTVQNRSPFPIGSLTVTEPGAQVSEFNKLDVSDYRVLFPAGATQAVVTVTCRTGANPPPVTYTGNQNKVPTGCTGPAASVSVTYTGSIAANATATLGVTGVLNDLVDQSDVATPQNPGNGVSNCAEYAGSTSIDGSGSTAGAVCATLPIQPPRTASPGVKTISQTSVPEGQPVVFGLPVINNGNLPLVTPGVADPQTDAAGNPGSVGNPFTSLQITAVTVSKSGGFTGDVVTEIFDPATSSWVAYGSAGPTQLAAATGVRSRATGNVNPGQGFTTTISTVRRSGVPDGQTLQNCVYTIGADGTQYPGIDPWCSPSFVTGAQAASASIAKSITPSTLPRPIPGLPQQVTQVKLAIANNGNLSLRQVQTQDTTPAFFDAVDFLKIDGVNFPAGANQVRFDVCTSVADCAAGTFQLGTPTSGTPALPTGVTPAQVLGVRFVFSNTNGGYSITPGTTFPNSGPCASASVCYSVAPRQTLRSDPATQVPSALQNTANGGLESPLQAPGQLQPIPQSQATLTLTAGTPKIAIAKGPSGVLSPGETAPFNITVTNTGTANLPDVRIVDPIPDTLVFNDGLIGDDSLPFRVTTANLPAGYPAPPTPTYQPSISNGKVSQVSFDFPGYNLPPGASITVAIEVSLSPGLAANTVSTNTAGATSPTTPNLACDGTSVVGGVFGEGTYCTASANITSQGGASFDARKWVAGNPALGWYNTATKAKVPTGDAACPSLVVARTVYTIYPCVALVNPGDRFDYVLRFVNAGTEPATVARLIDRLPVQGDTGVILPQQRGTEWANRPTMVGPPTVLQAPAGLATTQVLYTNGDVCNADLTLGGPGCAATDWDDSFGPDNSGFQLRFTFANPTYQPGDVMLIGFSMTTPLEVPYSSDPTIAWNSFAHSETTANGTNLPPTEPLQVGIATAYGNLQVAKVIGENPFDLDFSGTQFNFHYTCTSTPQGGSPTQVADGNVLATPLIPGLVEHIPAGATCRVWETDSVGGTPNGDGASEADPVIVDITWDPAEDAPIPTATITNDYVAGQVTVTKAVTGAAAAEFGTGPFTVELSCVYPDGRVVAQDPALSFTGSGTSDPIEAPVGSTCIATEPEDGQGGAWSSTIDPAGGVLITPDSATDPIDISVTNDFPNGTLQIIKELDGPGAPSYGDGPFIFEVSCSFNGVIDAFTGELTLSRTDPAATSLAGTVGPIPAGALCAVTETNNGGADDPVPDPIGSVLILPDGSDGSPVTVSFTNVFSQGSLDLTKTVTGAGAGADYAAGPFTFQVTCLRTITGPDGEPLETTVPLPDGGVVE
ncbi:MAG: DUF5979 domain-containing protein, partial [Nakamurella sp.]